MSRIRTRTAALYALVAATAWAMPTASADTAINVLSGVNGKVNIGERSQTAPVLIDYLVDVLDAETEVALFAVSNGGALSGSPPLRGGNGRSWDAEYFLLDEAAWERGVIYTFGGVRHTTREIGHYRQFFGDDPWVALYSIGYLGATIKDGPGAKNDRDMSTWTPTSPRAEFWVNAASLSNFVAVSPANMIVDRSLPVPEPTSGLLAATAFLLTAKRRRRCDSASTVNP